MVRGMVTNLQVFLQPLILFEYKVLAKFKIEINFSGKGDDVCWPQVPAVDTHNIKVIHTTINQYRKHAGSWMISDNRPHFNFLIV